MLIDSIFLFALRIKLNQIIATTKKSYMKASLPADLSELLIVLCCLGGLSF